jgi:SAM-dependent methyltransferase
VDEADGTWAGKDERVFVHLPLERTVLRGLGAGARILDLGCGDGSHMPLLESGGFVVGLDVSLPSLRRAFRFGPVSAGAGEYLPFAQGAFDLVYVSHTLHHAMDHRRVLSEIHRVLKPGGVVFLLETCEDSPLMRLARTVRPQWESVPVRCRFRFSELLNDVRRAGFTIAVSEQFNVLYWIWGFARRKFRPLERLQHQVIRAELAAVRRWRRFSAYGYLIGNKPSVG